MGVDIDIALTLFTVLAPAGAVCLLAIVAFVLAASRADWRVERLEKWMILPIACSMTGLVASAAHLGTPGNALYVFAGWGRSPLSNEVISALVFLLISGLYWVSLFYRPLPGSVRRGCLAAVALACLWVVGRIGVVYSVPTIPTWDTPLVPLILWTMSVASGSALFVMTMALALSVDTGSFSRPEAADDPSKDGTLDRGSLLFVRATVAIGLTSLVFALVLLVLQSGSLGEIRDSFGTAADLVPWYGLAILAYAGASFVGYTFLALPLFRGGTLPRRVACVLSTALVLSGAAMIRSAFYSMHMTIGL